MQTFESQASSKNKNIASAKTVLQPLLQTVKQNNTIEEGTSEENFIHPEHAFANMKIYSPSLPFPKPFQHKMESAFNEDFSSVKVHTNSDKATELNALAFTQTEEIHFAPGQYNTSSAYGQQLIGHELAHISQQRKGIVAPTIQTKGIQINDDTRLEQQASEMGKKAAETPTSVSPYQSKALGIRNNLRTIQRATNNVIQRATVPTLYGEFEDINYDIFKPAGKALGVNIVLEFRPGSSVDATKIGLTQTIHETLGGKDVSIDPATSSRMVQSGFAQGTAVDRISSRNTPIYGSPALNAGQNLKDTPMDNNSSGTPTIVGNNATYQLGFNFTDKTGTTQTQSAQLNDTPRDPGRNKNAGQVFETTALALEGTQQGMYYGSVQWGWEADSKGKFEKLPLTLVSKGMPSERFMKAAQSWNAARTMGTLKTTADPTSVFNNASWNVTFKIPKDTAVTILDQGTFWTHADKRFSHVTVAEGTHAGQSGFIRVNDMKDQGDGSATNGLPIVTEIYAGPYDDILDVAPIAQVPRNTKIKIIDNSDPITVLVEVMEGRFLGRHGYVNKIGGIPFTNIMK